MGPTGSWATGRHCEVMLSVGLGDIPVRLHNICFNWVDNIGVKPTVFVISRSLGKILLLENTEV